MTLNQRQKFIVAVALKYAQENIGSVNDSMMDTEDLFEENKIQVGKLKDTPPDYDELTDLLYVFLNN